MAAAPAGISRRVDVWSKEAKGVVGTGVEQCASLEPNRLAYLLPQFRIKRGPEGRRGGEGSGAARVVGPRRGAYASARNAVEGLPGGQCRHAQAWDCRDTAIKGSSLQG